jgi:hypothetical protein
VKRVTWQLIADDVDEAIELCRNIGLADLVQASRFAAYRQRLRELLSALARGGQEAARDVFDTDRILSGVALGECAELATLVPFIKSQTRETIRPKLERVLIGPVIPTDEDQNSSRGRNTLFELNLAAKLWTAGLDPTLGERPDLSCEIDGRRMLIECKRPASMGGARKAIAKARDQIVRDLKTCRAGSRGVIALSVAKIVNPGDRLFVYRGEAAGRAGLSAVLDSNRNALEDTWRALPDKIMGMIWHLVTIAVDEETHLGIVAQETTVNGFLRRTGRRP